MKKNLLPILIIALFVTGCGKKDAEETAAETNSIVAETESSATDTTDTEETEPAWKKPAFTQEDLESLDDEDDDIEFEPETAELGDGVALKIELEEKYGFEVRNLEKVSFLTYLDYEELFKILHYECDGSYVEFLTDSIELSSTGGRCPIIIDGYKPIMENSTLYLSYNNGYYNISEESSTKGN